MDTLFEIEDQDLLHRLAGGRRRRASEPSPARVAGVRFAFHGPTSTAEYQDPATSRACQHEIASALVAGHATITLEFFDVGCSRRVAWERRPQAAALLQRACAADRSFDAVVGEFERAFTDRQFQQVAGLLAEQGIEVWLPEAGGPVLLEDPTHLVLMQVLAAQSQREVVRPRHPTVAAMGVQAVEQGRWWSAAVRVSVGRCGPASESGTRRVGASAPAVGSEPGDGAACAVDVRRAPGRAERGGHRAGVERAWRAVPVDGGS